jgi:hypothetical protein
MVHASLDGDRLDGGRDPERHARANDRRRQASV